MRNSRKFCGPSGTSFMVRVAIWAKRMRPTATIHMRTMELVIGNPNGRAISTAFCDRPCSSGAAQAKASRAKKMKIVETMSVSVLGRCQGRLDQPRPIHIDVRLQHCPTEPANVVENHLHVPLMVQHEQGRSPGLHHRLDLAYEVVPDPDCRRHPGALRRPAAH